MESKKDEREKIRDNMNKIEGKEKDLKSNGDRLRGGKKKD